MTIGDRFHAEGAWWKVLAVALDGSKVVAEAQDNKKVPATRMFDISELQ